MEAQHCESLGKTYPKRYPVECLTAMEQCFNVLVPILLHLILYQHTQVLTCLCKSMSIVSGCSQSKLCEGEILEQYYLISVQLS